MLLGVFYIRKVALIFAKLHDAKKNAPNIEENINCHIYTVNKREYCLKISNLGVYRLLPVFSSTVHF